MKTNSSHIEKYKGKGFKLTPQRLAILDYLEGNTKHPSAEEIYRVVGKQYPTMSFATVYNTLDALRRKGDILELTIDPKKKRFDPNTGSHHHLICTSCKKIVDIQKDFEITGHVNIANGFEITGSHIEFYGLCPACKAGEPHERAGKWHGR